MNKSEKLVITSTLENIYAGTERMEKEDLGDFALRMRTSAKDGCHTIMRLVESNEGNINVIKNTLLWLEKRDYIDDELSAIIADMVAHNFNGE